MTVMARPRHTDAKVSDSNPERGGRLPKDEAAHHAGNRRAAVPPQGERRMAAEYASRADSELNSMGESVPERSVPVFANAIRTAPEMLAAEHARR